MNKVFTDSVMNKQMFILKPTVLFGGKEKRSQALGVQVCVCVKDVIIRQYLSPPHMLPCKNSQSMKELMQIDTLFIIVVTNTNS